MKQTSYEDEALKYYERNMWRISWEAFPSLVTWPTVWPQSAVHLTTFLHHL